MTPKGFLIPSFFIPIIAFVLWNVLFFSYLPVLHADLDYSRQIILANLYLSNIILILTWFLCGKIIFIVFACVFGLLVCYLMLSLREWGLAVQILTMSVLYLWLKHTTSKIEREKMNQMMKREGIQETLNLSQKRLEEKDHLLQALIRKKSRLEYMRQFSDYLKEASQLDTTGQIITREVAALIPEADQVLLYVHDEALQELALVAATNKNESFQSKDKKGNEYDSWVVKRSQPLLIEDAKTDFRFMQDDKTEHQFRSRCLVPLLSKSNLCGVLHLGAEKSSVFHTDDLRLLDIAADLSAAAIRNILLYEKTKELSIVDSLTECYLQRHIQERLGEEIHRAIRNTSPFSIIMADIDHFKTYNDELGHTAGDVVLKNIAAIIRNEVGPSNIVGRYGGEEFIIILPQKDLEEAMILAESIRKRIESESFELRRETRNITISMGISQFPLDGTGKAELIQKADSRMYEAKRQGRNRVCGNI